MFKHMTATFSGVCIFAAVAFSLSSMAQSGTPDDAMKAYMEAQQKMMTSMQNMKMTGNPDNDFVMMMIPHHQGAIDMAEVEVKYGKDAKLQDMAKAIIKAQTQEIGEMKKWQQEHGL